MSSASAFFITDVREAVGVSLGVALARSATRTIVVFQYIDVQYST